MPPTDRPSQRTGNDTADHRCNQAGEDGRVGRYRDAKGKWQRDQEHHQ
jgi:hypothetical protein